MTVAELAYEQLKTRPESQAREVLEFICWLKERGDRGQWEDLMAAQSGTLSVVWDHADDEAWNDL